MLLANDTHTQYTNPHTRIPTHTRSSTPARTHTHRMCTRARFILNGQVMRSLPGGGKGGESDKFVVGDWRAIMIILLCAVKNGAALRRPANFSALSSPLFSFSLIQSAHSPLNPCRHLPPCRGHGAVMFSEKNCL